MRIYYFISFILRLQESQSFYVRMDSCILERIFRGRVGVEGACGVNFWKINDCRTQEIIFQFLEFKG